MTPLPRDWSEFIELLNEKGVEYMIVGAHALALHGIPRLTQDIDFWVRSSAENSNRFGEVLRDFGFGSLQVGEYDFNNPDLILQLGNPPNRIDVMTSIDGVQFDEADKARLKVKLNGHEVWIISKEHLLKNKQASGRPKDLADADEILRDKSCAIL